MTDSWTVTTKSILPDAVMGAERKAPKRSKGGPLASFGNAAIGAQDKSDGIDLVVTVHQWQILNVGYLSHAQ